MFNKAYYVFMSLCAVIIGIFILIALNNSLVAYNEKEMLEAMYHLGMANFLLFMLFFIGTVNKEKK